jgi:hypothetical protein
MVRKSNEKLRQQRRQTDKAWESYNGTLALLQEWEEAALTHGITDIHYVDKLRQKAASKRQYLVNRGEMLPNHERPNRRTK